MCLDVLKSTMMMMMFLRLSSSSSFQRLRWRRDKSLALSLSFHPFPISIPLFLEQPTTPPPACISSTARAQPPACMRALNHPLEGAAF